MPGWTADLPEPERLPIAETGRLRADLPLPRPDDRYVSSASCRECHREEHASWHRSYHRTMTQAAEPGKVLGRFDGTTVMSEGLEYRVTREGDAFFADMPDPDVLMYVVQGGRKLPLEKIPRVRRPVVMTTGSHHYQTYWVSSSRYDRLLQTLPLVYLIGEGRWIPREAAFMRPPDDRGRFITQWNHHCIRCHSTGGNPGLDEATGKLRSEVAELGISCEACHGPGGDHVRYQRHLALLPPEQRPKGEDRTLVNPADLDHRRSSQVCGQCHGVYVMHDEFAMDSAKLGPLFRPGDDLERTRYYIQHPGADASPERRADLERNSEFFRERWWDDGTILAGGREYTALSASACYLRGKMSCLSCHSAHRSDPNDQLRPDMDGPRACVQCHEGPRYTTEITKHTFHAAGSSGSNCLNCHMPHTTYALFSAIRSHQIGSPQIRSSARQGVPNACNLCHLDRTLAWTGEHLERWYGQAREPLNAEQSTTSAALLWMLKGHAAQRVIVAWHAGWGPAQAASGADWIAPFQATLLDDPYGVVRYVADRGLRRLPGFEEWKFDFLAPTEERRRRVGEARVRWGEVLPRPGRRGEEVLIDAGGRVRMERLEQLLRARDDRPVTIKE